MIPYFALGLLILALGVAAWLLGKANRAEKEAREKLNAAKEIAETISESPRNVTELAQRLRSGGEL